MQSIDISKKINLSVLNLIEDACDYAYKRKNKVCTTLHLLMVSCNDRVFKDILIGNKIDCRRLEQTVNDLQKNNQYPINLQYGKVVFSPGLKLVILKAYAKCLKRGIEYLEKKDFLYFLLEDVSVRSALESIGIKPSSIDQKDQVSGTAPKEDNLSGISLEKFSDDLSQKAKKGELEEIVDREKELSQVLRILVRKDKNNVILIGENGVGKGSIVYLLTQRILDDSSFNKLANTRILELSITSLLSLMSMRNVQNVIEAIQEELVRIGKTIFFIRNFDLITDEFNVEKTIILNFLKSFFISKNVRFILSMNTATYRQLQSKEQTFTNQFDTVKISEPSVELAEKILFKVAEKLMLYHKIKISSSVITLSIILSERYIQDKFLPTKAIDVLDEASSKAVLEGRGEVLADDIKNVVSEKTGIPLEKLTESDQEKLIELENLLNQIVIGQEDAVHTVSEVVRRSRAGLKDPKKPIGSFLFLGPSGVGKTYLAKNLAKIVYDDESAMIRLDMSEFSESHTVQRLIGSPPGYVGYEEGGQLTNPVWERPYSLILLDEIEKANMKVFDIFLQVLDEGRLTDGQGRTIDFKNTIIIATSNVASEEILQKLSSVKDKESEINKDLFVENEIMPLMKSYFRPEFINRFDEIVVFNPLGREDLVKIAAAQINKIRERLKEKNISIEISESKLQEFAKRSYKPAFGARPIIRLIQDEVENVIARKIISNEIREGDTIYL